MVSLRLSLFIFIILISGTIACKKSDKQLITPAISWSGLAIVGDSIHFSCNTGNTLQWNFGDSSTSVEIAPNHVYSHPGTFVVKLVINGDNTQVAKTNLTIYPDPVYTHLIAGNRVWHHYIAFYEEGNPGTITNYNDTSFAINYIDPLTMAVGNDTVTFAQFIANDSVLLFFRDILSSGHTTGSYNQVTFNHVLDTVSFQKYTHISAASYMNEVYYTF